MNEDLLDVTVEKSAPDFEHSHHYLNETQTGAPSPYYQCTNELLIAEEGLMSRQGSNPSICVMNRKPPASRREKKAAAPELKPIEVHTAERLKHQVEDYIKRRIEYLEVMRDTLERVQQQRLERQVIKGNRFVKSVIADGRANMTKELRHRLEHGGHDCTNEFEFEAVQQLRATAL